MKPILKCIGIAGQRRAGKDTLADYLAPRLVKKVAIPVHAGIRYEDASWGRGSFASPVKRIFCETFNKSLAFVEEWKVKNEKPPGMDMTVRQALTFIGDGFRKIQPDIWIEMAFRPESDPYDKVYSDLRYINEAHKIKEQGGLNVMVYREGGLNWDDNGSEAQVRPLVMWCIETGREGRIADWPEFRDRWVPDRAQHEVEFQNKMFQYSNLTWDEVWDGLAQFDLFIRSDDGVENVYRKADEIVLPYIKDNYEFEDHGS